MVSASFDVVSTGLTIGSVLVSVLAAEAVSAAGVVTELLFEAESGKLVDWSNIIVEFITSAVKVCDFLAIDLPIYGLENC